MVSAGKSSSGASPPDRFGAPAVDTSRIARLPTWIGQPIGLSTARRLRRTRRNVSADMSRPAPRRSSRRSDREQRQDLFDRAEIGGLGGDRGGAAEAAVDDLEALD